MKLNNQLEDHLVEQATKRLSNELMFKLLSHWQSSRIFSSVLGMTTPYIGIEPKLVKYIESVFSKPKKANKNLLVKTNKTK